MNKAQLLSLKNLWQRNNQGMSFLAFRRTAKLYFGDYYGVMWCGMFIGIEQDGYAHS